MLKLIALNKGFPPAWGEIFQSKPEGDLGSRITQAINALADKLGCKLLIETDNIIIPIRNKHLKG